MAVRKDNTTGLEYTRSLTDEEQKVRAVASADRIYSVASYVFAIGLFAVGALCVISFMNKAPMMAIICEITVFICLIALLVLVSRSRRRMHEQRVKNERYPYASVDKKEIDKIFDLIADEEKKRERLNLFASNSNGAAESRGRNENAAAKREKEAFRASAAKPVEEDIPVVIPGDNTQDAAAERQKEEEMSVVNEEELNDVEIRMRAMEAEEEEPAAASEEKDETDDKVVDEEESGREKRRKQPEGQRSRDGERPRQRPAGKRPPQGSKAKKRPAGDEMRDSRDSRAQQGAKKRRPPPYDPYYGGPVYYDEYGRPIRRPPPYDPYYGGGYYYDGYGEPVRRREPPYAKERVYYDEYGNPIRRRSPMGQDPRREDPARRRRPAAPGQPGADPSRRRPADSASKTAPGAPEKKSRMPAAPVDPSKRTAAPVAMPSRKQDFDEEYVPVFIPYEEENEALNDAERGAVPLRANTGRKPAVPAAPPKPIAVDEEDYSPAELEAVPIIVDDDYNPDYGEEESFGSQAASAGYGSRGAVSSSGYDYNDDDVSPHEIDAGVVVVHDFDDIDQEEYEARYSRDYNGSASVNGVSGAAKSKQNYAVTEDDYSYEDESVIVLPRDENYEEYMQKVKEEEEKKRQEEEKQRVLERRRERRKNGKVTLTIRKVRRKKIHRNSRKYKRFRASVVPLIRYLSAEK